MAHDYEEDEEVSEGPEEGDILTDDHEQFFQYERLVLTVGPDSSTRTMWKALDDYMKRSNFFPNVWFVSDHGNAHLMVRETRSRRRSR